MLYANDCQSLSGSAAIETAIRSRSSDGIAYKGRGFALNDVTAYFFFSRTHITQRVSVIAVPAIKSASNIDNAD